MLIEMFNACGDVVVTHGAAMVDGAMLLGGTVLDVASNHVNVTGDVANQNLDVLHSSFNALGGDKVVGLAVNDVNLASAAAEGSVNGLVEVGQHTAEKSGELSHELIK